MTFPMVAFKRGLCGRTITQVKCQHQKTSRLAYPRASSSSIDSFVFEMFSFLPISSLGICTFFSKRNMASASRKPFLMESRKTRDPGFRNLQGCTRTSYTLGFAPRNFSACFDCTSKPRTWPLSFLYICGLHAWHNQPSSWSAYITQCMKVNATHNIYIYI